jgi:hypothetical protein
MIEAPEIETSIASLQRQFAAALMRPALPLPAAVAASKSEAQRLRRFNIYRNNVHSSLATALAARFPVVERLVGEEFFLAMALVFIDRHPPSSPVLSEYGAHFPAFLESFEPVAELVYLPDVARLEWLRNVAYHAADAETVAISALANAPAADLAHTCLVLHPATGCISSDHPIVSIWRTNTHDEEVTPIGAEATGETALVTRPGLDVLVTTLPSGGGAFLTALARGADLDAAVRHATEMMPLFDVPATLAVLFGSGGITRIEMPAAGPLKRGLR